MVLFLWRTLANTENNRKILKVLHSLHTYEVPFYLDNTFLIPVRGRVTNTYMKAFSVSGYYRYATRLFYCFSG